MSELEAAAPTSPPAPSAAGPNPAQENQSPQANEWDLWVVVALCVTLLAAVGIAWLVTRTGKETMANILGIVVPFLTAVGGAVFGQKVGNSSGQKAGKAQAKQHAVQNVLPQIQQAQKSVTELLGSLGGEQADGTRQVRIAPDNRTVTVRTDPLQPLDEAIRQLASL